MIATTSERIASAALEILAAEGSGGVTIRRVAGEVGLSPMAIYRHYADREALLTSVADKRFVELASECRDKPHHGQPTELIEASLSSLLDFALQEPHVYDCLFLEPRRSARQFPAGFVAGASPTFTILADLVEHAMAEHVLADADPWEVAFGLAAIVHGLVQLERGGRLSLSEEELRALCMRSVRRMLNGLAA
jgi:AcrR family transcriptional regulator